MHDVTGIKTFIFLRDEELQHPETFANPAPVDTKSEVFGSFVSHI